MRRLLDQWAERTVLGVFSTITRGQLLLDLPAGRRLFGPGGSPCATLRVQDPRFFRRAITGGEVGLGESYMDGDWSTPDLVALVRLMLANRASLAAMPD